MINAEIFSQSFVDMLIRLLLSVVVNLALVGGFYYRRSRRNDFYFTFMLIGVAIFLLVFFMIFILDDMKGKAGIGLGMGLFGIFSIMRYRTDTMPVREMTYLFVVVSVSVINALALNMSFLELTITNLVVIGGVALGEGLLKVSSSKLVQYDRIELILPERREELIADLESRLGIKVIKVDVGSVDFLRDMAMLRVYYKSRRDTDSVVNNMVKLPKGE
ncbi:MAG: DUF4956 domain-containing protein [Muribaculaceae bacterium]|nr:DUF4956 domain-containing protein [Muribaculaceae bacterium]